MSYRTTLMGGTSALALILAAAAPAAAQTAGQFVFGIATGVVTASVGSSGTGTLGVLSSQVNNDLSLSSALGENTLITGTGTTTAGGSAGLSDNVMSATAIANQFSNASGATYVLDPSYAPSAGFATLGTSQLNYNTAATTNNARLGLAGAGAAGEGNSVAFTAGGAYGAPVSLNSNSFAARANGNLTLSSVSGAVPLGGFATSAASIVASGTSAAAAPVGADIIITAPLSLSNVQQNISSGATATTALTASTANTAVSALFNGTAGFNGGSVTVSTNSVTAITAANSATVALDLSSASNPTLAGGVSVFSAQGNNANVTGSGLAIGATNTNTTLRIMSEDAAVGLTAMSNSTATLAGNTISSRAALNDLTSQTLITSSTLTAGGSRGASASPQLFGPDSTLSVTVPAASSTGSVNVSGDYLNVAVQNNLGISGTTALTGNATVENPVVGFFGGVTSGAVSVQGNTISGAVQGNVAAVATIMPLISGSASSLTGLMQQNADLTLTSTVSGAQIRISDSANLLFGTAQNLDVTTGDVSVVAPALAGSTFTGATLNIGSADTAALGNSVRATAFANSGSASANLGQITSGTNSQVTLFGVSGSTATLPNGVAVALTAPTSVVVIQENRGVVTTAQVTNANAAFGTAANGLFQIDAYQGLTNGAANIGNNSLRSTAVGNFGEAAAALTGATSNSLAGGVAVGTFQGNANSTVNAFLGGTVTSTNLGGPVASIGVGALTSSTAQVVNNTFAAVAVGNSATGLLAIPAGTILGGTVATTTTQYTNAAEATGALTGSYVVGNSQTNAATTVAASNLDEVTYTAGLAGGAFFDTATTIGSSGFFPSRMNIGATSFTSANALVTGNTVATTAVGSEYNSTVSGFVTGVSATGYTALSLGNTQRNIDNTTDNSTVRSVNVGNSFLVSTAATGAAGTVGNTDNTGSSLTAIATNSVLSVAGNTASAAATANSSRLGVTGIANSGADPTTFAATLGATAGGTQSSAGAVAITNAQSNTFVAVSDNAAAILAVSNAQNFGVNIGTGAATIGSTLQVNTNAMTATATANSADLSATLATGPAYQGGLGLNNMQSNVGALNNNGATPPVSTTNTTVLAVVANGFFNAGTSRSTSAAVPTISFVEDSTVSVSGNRMVATATQNMAMLSVTAASSTLVQGPGLTGTSSANTAATGSAAFAAASIAGVNVQTIDTMNTQAIAGNGYFTATADAVDSTVAVNSNVVGAVARGNTAETMLSVPRIDGTMEAFNAQSVSNGNTVAQTFSVVMNAATNGTGATTINTPVSVSSNLVSAASTVNNYAATMSGLGQSGTAGVTQANGTVTGGVLRNTGTLTLGSSQLISGGQAAATILFVDVGISLANSATTSSPLSVNSNTVSASANGNVSAQAMLANGSGADSQAGMGNYSAQRFGVAGAPATNSEVLASVGLVNILAQIGAETGVTTPNNPMTGSPVSVSGNVVSATATANTASLSTVFDGTIRSAGGGSGSTADQATGNVTADYALANVQSMVGDQSPLTASTRATAFSGTVNIGATLANSTTTASPIDISSNSVTTTANGNVAALSMIGNVAGAAVAGGSALSSDQVMATSLVSATTTGTAIRAQMDGSALPAAYSLTNSPVTISGNMVGASATGNSASLNSGFASSVRANGTGNSGTASTAAAGASTANGDYVLLNTQRASFSTVSASTMATTISYAGASSNGAVSLRNNTVFATAFGNTATMAQSGAQAGGSTQSTNYQQTNGTTVSALISGTTIGANMANRASSSAPVSVSSNVLRAVAVGNSVTNAIGR